MKRLGALRRSGDQGQLTAFVAVLMLGLMLCAGLVLDGGLALSAKTRALDDAQEAARTGAQVLDAATLRAGGTAVIDSGPARQAALQYLAVNGDTGTVTISGDTITVTATRHQNTQILQLAGVDTLTVTATASVRSERGVSAPDPGLQP